MSNDNSGRKVIKPDVTWREITPGGVISDPGNSEMFKTGDWRSKKPVYFPDRCKQCLMCIPICPDASIRVNDETNSIEIDYDHCKGCGLCTKACPFKAIEMTEER